VLASPNFATEFKISYNKNENGPIYSFRVAFIFTLSTFLLGVNSCTIKRSGTDRGPLLIQEQESFTTGGSVITNPGIFDPYKPASAGQTFQGMPLMQKIPMNKQIRWCLIYIEKATVSIIGPMLIPIQLFVIP
jgi:hypothetical protein